MEGLIGTIEKSYNDKSRIEEYLVDIKQGNKNYVVLILLNVSVK